MTQAVNCQLLIVEAQIQCQARPRGICGGQSGTGTCLSQHISGFIFSVIHQHTTSLFHSSTTNNNN